MFVRNIYNRVRADPLCDLSMSPNNAKTTGSKRIECLCFFTDPNETRNNVKPATHKCWCDATTVAHKTRQVDMDATNAFPTDKTDDRINSNIVKAIVIFIHKPSWIHR